MMNPTRKLAIVGLALFAGVLCAQEYRATVVGTVADPTGAVVPTAKVTAINTETGVASSTESGADGDFVIPFLVPGVYSLRVEKPGFKTTDRGPIELRVNDRTRIDVGLDVGQSSDKRSKERRVGKECW